MGTTTHALHWQAATHAQLQQQLLLLLLLCWWL